MNYFLAISNSIRSNQFSRTFSVYTIGKGISVLLSLFLLPLFTKRIPTYEFGIIGLLWLVTPLLTNLMSLGMGVGVSLKFFKQNHQTLSNTLYNGLFTITTVSVFIYLLGYINIGWIQFIIDESVTSEIFTLLVISCLFSYYTVIMCGFLQNSGRAVYNVVMTILPQLIIVLVTYFLILFINASYTSYVFGMALGNLITGVIALGFFLKNYSIRYFQFSIKIIKNLLRIGLPVVPGTIGTIILASGDRYLIKSFLGLEAVAIYIFGYRFAEQISQGLFQPFQKALSPVIFKKAAEDDLKGRIYNIQIINKVTLLFSIIIAVLLVPFHDVMNIMGNISYNASYLIFMISLIGIFIYTIAQAESYSLVFMERTELTAITVLLGAVVNIVLNIMFIPKYGIVAAAFTTIIAYLVMFLSRNYFLFRFFKINNLLGLIGRIMPLIIYITVFIYIDKFIEGSVYKYILKISCLFLYFIFTVKLYPDLKYLIESFSKKEHKIFREKA